MQSGQPLYLIGFMASGKTTLGRALALRLPGYEFVDLDEAIECIAKKSIPDIFASEGEAVFRELEARAPRQYSVPGSIIACGGGTPCYAANMDYMLANGRVVWLVADDEVTRRRLRLARGLRPLSTPFLTTMMPCRHISRNSKNRAAHITAGQTWYSIPTCSKTQRKSKTAAIDL